MQALDIALNCGIDPAAPWVTHLTAAYADNGCNKGTGGNRSSSSSSSSSSRSNRNSSSNKGTGEGEKEERVRATLDRGERHVLLVLTNMQGRLLEAVLVQLRRRLSAETLLTEKTLAVTLTHVANLLWNTVHTHQLPPAPRTEGRGAGYGVGGGAGGAWHQYVTPGAAPNNRNTNNNAKNNGSSNNSSGSSNNNTGLSGGGKPGLSAELVLDFCLFVLQLLPDPNARHRSSGRSRSGPSSSSSSCSSSSSSTGKSGKAAKSVKGFFGRISGAMGALPNPKRSAGASRAKALASKEVKELVRSLYRTVNGCVLLLLSPVQPVRMPPPPPPPSPPPGKPPGGHSPGRNDGGSGDENIGSTAMDTAAAGREDSGGVGLVAGGQAAWPPPPPPPPPPQPSSSIEGRGGRDGQDGRNGSGDDAADYDDGYDDGYDDDNSNLQIDVLNTLLLHKEVALSERNDDEASFTALCYMILPLLTEDDVEKRSV